MTDEVGVKTRIARRTWQLKVGHGKQPHKQDKQTGERSRGWKANRLSYMLCYGMMMMIPCMLYVFSTNHRVFGHYYQLLTYR